MFYSKTFRFLTKIIISLTLISVCALGYLNFGQASHPNDTMNTALSTLQARMAQTLPHAVTLESCKKSLQYSCIEKAFSEKGTTSNGEDANFSCVSLDAGVNICPTGQLFTYDSSAAAKKCVGSACESQYNFNEYTCVYQQVNESGSLPIQATASSLELALADTYKACLGVAQMSAAVANSGEAAK